MQRHPPIGGRQPADGHADAMVGALKGQEVVGKTVSAVFPCKTDHLREPWWGVGEAGRAWLPEAVRRHTGAHLSWSRRGWTSCAALGDRSTAMRLPGEGLQGPL